MKEAPVFPSWNGFFSFMREFRNIHCHSWYENSPLGSNERIRGEFFCKKMRL